jgi:hypothetical protein
LSICFWCIPVLSSPDGKTKAGHAKALTLKLKYH